VAAAHRVPLADLCHGRRRPGRAADERGRLRERSLGAPGSSSRRRRPARPLPQGKRAHNEVDGLADVSNCRHSTLTTLPCKRRLPDRASTAGSSSSGGRSPRRPNGVCDANSWPGCAAYAASTRSPLALVAEIDDFGTNLSFRKLPSQAPSSALGPRFVDRGPIVLKRSGQSPMTFYFYRRDLRSRHSARRSRRHKRRPTTSTPALRTTCRVAGRSSTHP
jgi:hypothetical protein